MVALVERGGELGNLAGEGLRGELVLGEISFEGVDLAEDGAGGNGVGIGPLGADVADAADLAVVLRPEPLRGMR